MSAQSPPEAQDGAADEPGSPSWRKRERTRLVAAREAVQPSVLTVWRAAIDRHLLAAFSDLHEGIVGFCWPYRNEYDPRPLLARLRASGANTALPAVIGPRLPLEFRIWRPGDVLARGVYDIPYPAYGAARVPDTLLVPMNGFDGAGYRLGYGGGYFDRTLAALPHRPRVIGIAYDMAIMPSIYPLAHDIPMDWIVTESGVREGRAAVYLRNSR